MSKKIFKKNIYNVKTLSFSDKNISHIIIICFNSFMIYIQNLYILHILFRFYFFLINIYIFIFKMNFFLFLYIIKEIEEQKEFFA